MKLKLFSQLLIFVLLTLNCKYKTENNNDLLNGLSGPYLGQELPKEIPELFAPGIVSDGLDNRDIAIMPNGKEIYFSNAVGGTEYVTILCSREEKGIWTKPEVVCFAANPGFMYYEPCISTDGNKLFFTSNMPINDSLEMSEPNIWYVQRHEDKWGNPIVLDTTINSIYDEYFPSITKDGTLYFTRGSKTGEYFIYRSIQINGKYTKAVKLPKQVNSGKNRFNAFVDRDERYLILSIYGLSETVGGMDYYIVFRNENDTWSNPIDLGDQINTKGNDEYSPYVSPDGKYFFFMSKRSIPKDSIPKLLTYDFLHKMHNHYNNGDSDIYWIDAKIIEELRTKDPK